MATRGSNDGLRLAQVPKRVLGWKPLVDGLGWLGAGCLRLLGSTWRVTIEGDDPLTHGAPPILGAFWHRNMLIAAFVFRDRGYAVPVSRSRDGELIAALLRRLGYAESPRGSSSRGGSTALRGLLRIARAGTSVSIQTDGPSGPARRSKAGVVALAKHAGIDIVPMVFSARPCWHFRSWDGTLLPFPFASVVCGFGPHLSIGSGSPPEHDEAVRCALDRELNRMTDALDERMALRDASRPRD